MATLPAVIDPIDDVVVVENAEATSIDLNTNFDDPSTTGLVARFELGNTAIGTNGITNVVLFDQPGAGAPASVANFLNYVNDGDYVNTIIHRSIPGFVIQGGGFTVDGLEEALVQNPTSGAAAVGLVPEDAPVVNEFSAERSNVRGTLAYAKLGGNPDSATSEWFFNLANNSANLDFQNGGFTVFGEVLGDADLATIDAIAALATSSQTTFFQQGAFTNLPLVNADNPPNSDDDLVRYSSITVSQVDELEFTIVNNTNPELVTPSISDDGQLLLDYAPDAVGTAEITVRATTLLGETIEDIFVVNVEDAITPGTLEFSAGEFSVAEDGTVLVPITVNRTEGSDGEVSVTVSLGAEGDTATAPDDFDNTPITVTFGDGETTQTLLVPVVADSVAEAEESLTLSFGEPTGGASLGGLSTATLFIQDVFEPGVIEFTAGDFRIQEDGTAVVPVTVSRTGGSDGEVTVTLNLGADGDTAIAPGDYGNTPITITFTDGVEDTQTIILPIVDDSDAEGAERVTLTLSDPTGGVVLGDQTSATLVIEDDDAPVNNPNALDILLVNDDGFDAEGIQILFNTLTAAGYDVTLVAPKEQQSGTGTSINTDLIFQPLEIENFGPNQWFVNASPVVTTLTALDVILDGDEPDLVISGINEGANIGENIVISSGTVSAATEATRRGIPAIAISAEGEDAALTNAYNRGAQFVLDLIEELEATQNPGEELLPEGVGLNVNIPAEFAEGVNGIQGVALTRLDETSNIDLSFGELPPDFGEGAGLLVDINEPISPQDVTNPQSEGQQFLAGFITVTPVDGDWSAGETVRANLESRIDSAPEDAVATPLNILITNDDGFDAEGIGVLFDALTAAGHTVTLVAPLEEQSGRGTLLDVDSIFAPVAVEEFEPNKFSVDLAPRGVTWAALDFILAGETPDLVISGINEGENIGPGGAVSSGTVSAAVTALLRDVPAIALSAGIDLTGDGSLTSAAYDIGADFVVDLIAQLQATQGSASTILPERTGLSVNIPVLFPEGVDTIQGVAFTLPDDIVPLAIEVGELPEDFGGGIGLQVIPGELVPGAEVNPISEGGQFLSGFITVTPLDGDWNVEDDEFEAIADRLTPFAESQAPQDLVFGTGGDDIIDIAIPPETTPNFDGERDLIFTGAGDDLVDVSPSASLNQIFGGSGADELIAGQRDRLFGGEDDDILEASAGAGGNRLYGGDGDDQLVAGSGDRLFGAQGDDTLFLNALGGDGGNNRAYGEEGNDTFFLGVNDWVSGGLGDDSLLAGLGGNNTLYGGDGADLFQIVSSELPEAVNIIVDFALDIDRIGVSFAGIGAVADLGFTQDGTDALISVGDRAIARFVGISEADLQTASFTFL